MTTITSTTSEWVQIAATASVLIARPHGDHEIHLGDINVPASGSPGIPLETGKVVEITTIGSFGGYAYVRSVAATGSITHASA